MASEDLRDLDQVRARAVKCAAPRYRADPWPAAAVESAVADAALANAWQELANAATRAANRVRMGHWRVRPSRAALIRLIDQAIALEQPAHDAAVQKNIMEGRWPAERTP